MPKKKLFSVLLSLSLILSQVLAGILPFFPSISQAQAAVPTGFQDTTIFGGFNQPTAARFAPDGRVFVIEKSGIVKVFDNLADTTPTIFADLRTQVMGSVDRGLTGLAIHPNFPTQPYIYVAYTVNAPMGQNPPVYANDQCPNGTPACASHSRVSRLTANGNVMSAETILVADWCAEYGSHSIDDLHFGPEGALYVTGGEGASYNAVDYGQLYTQCGDPANEGGALRSQDIRTLGDPLGLSGTLIRIDPMTGAAWPTNPLNGGNPNDDRILAHGFRNPFRFDIDPRNGRIWVGDVGWSAWEEIDYIPSPTDPIKNFGWPCFEGVGRQSGYDSANIPLCESLYTNGGNTAPYYSYNHSSGSVISAVQLYLGTSYPTQYRGALFFADYNGEWIKVMHPDANGMPDPNNITTLATGVFPVDIQRGPNGDMFYVDIAMGEVHRISYFNTNTPPVAVASADPTSGSAPLTVNFNGSQSSDADPTDTLTYAWDLDGDGQTDDSTAVNPQYTYQTAGTYTVTLKVTDNNNASSTDTVSIDVGNSPPEATIDTPLATDTFDAGETVSFSGHATDPDTGAVPASELKWRVILHHCSVDNPTDCHAHPLQDFEGVDHGTFVYPDHEYPSHVEIQLTAGENTTPTNWWDTDWKNRSKLSLNNSAQAEDLTDFPVLIKLNSSRIDYSKTKAAGADLRFVDQNNTPLSYEIESWNPNGDSYIWVKIPQVDASTNNDFIWMYYGNSGGVVTTQNAQAVWANGYSHVFHMDGTAVNKVTNINGTYGATSTDTAGQIGRARVKTGTYAGSTLTTNEDRLSATGLTVETWYKPDGFRNWDDIVGQGWVANGFDLHLNATGNIVWGLGKAGAQNNVISFNPLIDGQMTYLVGTYNNATSNLYINATVAGTPRNVVGAANDVASTISVLANDRGTVDELRISRVARSAAWVSAQYKSMNDTFVVYNTAELSTGGTGLSDQESIMIHPNTTEITMLSEPTGLNLTIYGTSYTTPFTREVMVNAQTTISATSPQMLEDQAYVFESWSDEGAQTHTITASSSAQTFTATYDEAQDPIPSAPPTNTPTPTPTLTPSPTLTPTPTLTPSPTPTIGAPQFVKGINFNGNAGTIEGNSWISYSTALSQGLTITSAGGPIFLGTTSVVPNPAVDAATRNMFQTVAWRGENFTVNQTLTNGTYDIYFYVMENYQTSWRSFNAKLEGTQVQTGIASGFTPGQWKKYGPYTTTVTDGVLNLEMIKVLKEPMINGMSIFKR